MRKPKLLDLFCGAGGCSMGYHLAGYKVIGVDINPQKRYPFEFIQADALEYVVKYGKDYDVIHASPPCQAYSITKSLTSKDYPDLVEPTRNVLLSIGKPYIIENVPGAPLINSLKLCGTMFKLRVIRHRLFEIWPHPIYFPPNQCQHIGKASGNANYIGKERDLDHYEYLTITGHDFKVADAKIAMGIDWMIGKELSQAIPPAYTKWVGEQLIE